MEMKMQRPTMIMKGEGNMSGTHHNERGYFRASRRWVVAMVCLLTLIFLATCALLVMVAQQHGTAFKAASSKELRPNILYIMADDLGWNDIGYHNREVRTPYLDRLARQGRILDQHYMQPSCTPSRHALMTGIYPYKSKMQHFILTGVSPHCSPTDMTFLPEKLKTRGYKTHLMGKWHLGFCQADCTPTQRGFDSFDGMFGGMADQFTHTTQPPDPALYDWRSNQQLNKTANGTHTTDAVTDMAIQILHEHEKTEPFFMLLSHTVPHMPLQAPEKYMDMHADVKEEKRRSVYAMMTHLDDQVNDLINVLKKEGLYDNTLIIFTSDNGGAVTEHHDNSPLRGGKGSLFEGGTRAVGFVTGSLVHNTGQVHTGLMHVTDWHQTILSLAGLPADDSLDGVDQSEMILHGHGSKRTSLVYNLDMRQPESFGQAAMRENEWKLIWGYEGSNDGWGLNATVAWRYPPNVRELGLDLDPVTTDGFLLTTEDIKRMGRLMQARRFTPRDLNTGRVHLYNLIDDPSELHNLAQDPDHLDVVLRLKKRVVELTDDLVDPGEISVQYWTGPALGAQERGAWASGWCEQLDLSLHAYNSSS